MADQPKPKKLTLKPSTYRRPWHGYQSQKELNKERTKIPLMTVVNQKAHARIAAIRNSRNYQEAHAQNAQSALKVPKLKGIKVGRFNVSRSTPNIDNSELIVSRSEPSVTPPIPLVLINGKHGRFIVSETEPSATSSPPIRRRVFEVSNAPEGGRRTRKHSRRNISRRRRHVGRRRTHRNGA